MTGVRLPGASMATPSAGTEQSAALRVRDFGGIGHRGHLAVMGSSRRVMARETYTHARRSRARHYSAATSGLSPMRLFSRSRSSHSSCHSDGRLEGVTCTAVTLYSGQLVAQSEFSVVMTLAPLTGKWNVE